MSGGRQLLTLLFGLLGLAVALVIGLAVVGPLLTGAVINSPTATTNVTGQAIVSVPSPTATTAVPSATYTSTPEPSPTSTVAPTRTTTPSPTATETPSATATETSTPTYTATASPTVPPPTPTPTPTPRPPAPKRTPTPTQMPAPVLLGPGNGQLFGFGEVIVLQWQAVGPLPADAYYVPIVYFSRKPETWYDETEWVKGTSWTLSEHDYLPALSDDDIFHWAVQVQRLVGVDAQGMKIGKPLSRVSEERMLLWQKPPGPNPTSTPYIIPP
jgi:hypothetical protein